MGTHSARTLWRIALLVLALVGVPTAQAAPSVYSTPAYESPVRGDPDDLLLIPGYGFTAADKVIYEAVTNTTQLPAHPASAPATSSATLGVADVVNAADAPYSLAVHLPSAITPGQSYVLWVQGGTDHQWSSPLLINDARPLWITPDNAYRTAQLAGLPRELKIVGRNLQPAPGAGTVTQARLVGAATGTTYTLTAKNTSNDPANTTAALERYVAVVSLPATLVVDRYTVQVSRDGVSWISLLGNGQSAGPAQVFTVNSDPVTSTPFQVSDPQFADPVTGPCQPNDGVDDTACILLAIRAAEKAGGGTVYLGPGVWTMSNPGQFTSGIQFSDRLQVRNDQCVPPFPTETCGVSFYGVLLPVGVNLQGAGSTGANATTIEQTTGWTSAGSRTLFTLQGNNTVSGIAFSDDTDYRTFTGSEPLLMLGVKWWFAHLWGAADPVTAANIVITNNWFVRPYFAIGNGGLPVAHVYVTNNTFAGAYNTAIYLGSGGNQIINLTGNAVYPYTPYQFSDSVLSHNTFYPGSLYSTPDTYQGRGGTIATQINTGQRVDFSNNVADGTVAQYQYDPVNEPKGWRAAHFWSTGLNQEMTLVSNNRITCSGDKYGDGESIVFDGSLYIGGVPAAQPVTTSTSWTNPVGIAGTTVVLQGTIQTLLPVNTNPVSQWDISADPTPYYRGFWALVVQGKGKGQWRKIESVSVGTNSTGSTVTLNVTPAFDVPPDATSSVIVQYGVWQNATVNNYVDQRSPLCTKANTRNGGSGGIMSWYDATADSAMEGNRQYDTNGILIHQVYDEPAGSGQVFATAQSSNEVRENLINGTYNWDNTTGRQGGIQLGYGAFICSGTCPGPTPPDLGFGLAIAHNTLIQADGSDVDGSVHPPIGAIGLNPNWSTGPVDASGQNQWQIGDATLIFRNTLQSISNTISRIGGARRVGIGVDVALGSTANPAITWRSTLYGNACSNVDIPVSDFGLGTTRVCPAGASANCECAGIASADVGVSATSVSGPTPDGGNVTYTVRVTNNSTTTTASGIALSAEPSAGVQLHGASFTPSTGSCDASVNICSLGNLAPGQTATVTVTASLPASATSPVTFSVTHREADGVVSNDSTTVTAAGLVGYWSFDEGTGTTAADTSGGGNNGTLVNGPVWTAGKTGSALNFANPAAYVGVNGGGSLANLYATGMTITAWIRPAGSGGGGVGRIIDKDNNDSGWFLAMSGNNAIKFVADQFGDATSGAAASRTSTNSIALNTWQHVAVTWNTTDPNSEIHKGKNIHIYINGQAADGAAADALGAVNGDAGTPFTIGNRTVDRGRNFNGSIDAVRVYNRVLSRQEIQSLVNGGL